MIVCPNRCTGRLWRAGWVVIALALSVPSISRGQTIDRRLGFSPGAFTSLKAAARVYQRLPVGAARCSTNRLENIWDYNVARSDPSSAPKPAVLDGKIFAAYQAGVQPVINLISAPKDDPNDLTSVDWYWIGRRLAERYRPGSAFSRRHAPAGGGVTTYMIGNEINSSWYNSGPAGRQATKDAYVKINADFAKGVREGFGSEPGKSSAKASDANVYLGPLCDGYVDPNYKFSPATFVKMIADAGMFDPEHESYISGFGLQNYPTSDPSNEHFLGKLDVVGQVERIKKHAGITKLPLDFYVSEFNVELDEAANGDLWRRYVSEDDERLAASVFFSQIWINFTVPRGSSTEPATMFNLAFSPFGASRGQWVCLSRDGQYGKDNEDWVPNLRGKALQLATALGRDMVIQRVDPRASVVYAARPGQRLYAVNNIQTITNLGRGGRPGKEFVIDDIPEGASTLRAYHFNSIEFDHRDAPRGRPVPVGEMDLQRNREYRTTGKYTYRHLRPNQTTVLTIDVPAGG